MKRTLGIAATAVVLIASQAKAQVTDAEIRQILVDRVDAQHKSVGIVVGSLRRENHARRAGFDVPAPRMEAAGDKP